MIPGSTLGTGSFPNDDETSTRFIIYSIPSSGPESDRRLMKYFEDFGDYNPADHHNELFNEKKVPHDQLLQLTSAQDYVAAVGQGAVVDRTQERLGRSDMGIAFLRRIFLREIEAIRNGKPTKEWRRLQQATEMPHQIHELVEVLTVSFGIR